MKKILLELAAFNRWANEQLGNRILALPAEWQEHTVASSFSSLLATLQHLLKAESIWWQRLQREGMVSDAPQNQSVSGATLVEYLLAQNAKWEDWIRETDENQLQGSFNYENSRGEAFTQPVYQTLLHIFNHGTYHRGQLVTMLNQLQVTNIPATDFIVWTRTVYNVN